MGVGGTGGVALEGKGPPRRPQRRLDGRLEEVAKAVGGRLLSVTNAVELGVRETPAGRRLGALEGTSPPSNASLGVGGWLGDGTPPPPQVVRLQMPLKPALGVRGTVAGRRLGALEGGLSPPVPVHPWVGPGQR